MTFSILLQHGKSILRHFKSYPLPRYFTLEHYLAYLWVFIKAAILLQHNKQIRIFIGESKNILYEKRKKSIHQISL